MGVGGGLMRVMVHASQPRPFPCSVCGPHPACSRRAEKRRAPWTSEHKCLHRPRAGSDHPVASHPDQSSPRSSTSAPRAGTRSHLPTPVHMAERGRVRSPRAKAPFESRQPPSEPGGDGPQSRAPSYGPKGFVTPDMPLSMALGVNVGSQTGIIELVEVELVEKEVDRCEARGGGFAVVKKLLRPDDLAAGRVPRSPSLREL